MPVGTSVDVMAKTSLLMPTSIDSWASLNPSWRWMPLAGAHVWSNDMVLRSASSAMSSMSAAKVFSFVCAWG